MTAEFSPAPKLTLNREAPCPRCGLPTVWEWTGMWTAEGLHHVYCSGPGDAIDVMRAYPQLSEDDRAYLDAQVQQ